MPGLRLLAPSLALALLASTLAAPPAAAHAILVESLPAPNGAVAAGRLDIRLRFNSRIDARRSRLSLAPVAAEGRRPDETPVVARDSGRPDVLAADGAVTPGNWVLRWQVLAVDGHITRGAVPFKAEAGAK